MKRHSKIVSLLGQVVLFIILVAPIRPASAADIRVVEQPYDGEPDFMMAAHSTIFSDYETLPYLTRQQFEALKRVILEKYYRGREMQRTFFTDVPEDASGPVEISLRTVHLVASYIALRSAPHILVEGRIEVGDDAKLERVIEAAKECTAPGVCPFNPVIALDSPGGNAGVALRMAGMISRNDFPTFVPAGATCASSCSFLFFAGYSSNAFYQGARRFVTSNSRIGIHRPALSTDEAELERRGVTRLNVVEVVNGFANSVAEFYLTHGIDLSVMSRVYRTPPESMSWLNLNDLTDMNAEVLQQVVVNQDLTAEQAATFCRQRLSIALKDAPVFDTFGFVEKEAFYGFSGGTGSVCLGKFNQFEGRAYGWWYFVFTPRNDCDDMCRQAFAGLGLELTPGLIGPYGSLARLLMSETSQPQIVEMLRENGFYTFETSLPNTVPLLDGSFDLRRSPGEAGDDVAQFHGKDIVRRVQEVLAQKGYDPGAADGLVGAKTVAAMRSFAERSGVRYGGFVTKPMLEKLGIE